MKLISRLSMIVVLNRTVVKSLSTTTAILFRTMFTGMIMLNVHYEITPGFKPFTKMKLIIISVYTIMH